MNTNRNVEERYHKKGEAHKKTIEARRNSVLFGLVLVLILVMGLSILTVMGFKKLLLRNALPQPQTADAIPLSCPVTEPVALPSPEVPRSLYILIDRSRSFKAYTQWSIDVLKAVLPNVLSPGDHLTAAWIGNYSASPDSTFCCGRPIPEFPLPNLMPLPEKPIPPELLMPDEDASSMEIVQIEVENKHLKAQYDASLNAYYCAVEERNNDAETKITRWKSDKKELVDEFWLEGEPSFVVNQYDNSTQIREALYKASLLFQEDVQRKNRTLLIFTDLKEVGALSFDGVYPNLDGVQVVVVLRCENAKKCESLKAEWQDVFVTMGAVSPMFLQDSYPEEVLISLLQRR